MSNKNVPILYVVEVTSHDGKKLGYAVTERIAFLPIDKAEEKAHGLVPVTGLSELFHNCFIEKPEYLRAFQALEMPAERDPTGGVTMLASGRKPKKSDR